MYKVLFNPLSNGGRGPKKLNLLTRKLNKKKEEYEIIDLVKINNEKKFISSLKKDDKIIIVGGDGTLNRIANILSSYNLKNEIYLFPSGTGNDFSRNFKKEKKDGLINITDKLSYLPNIYYNNESEVFINGAGIGVDGLICHYVNQSIKPKSSINYYKNCFKAFKNYEPGSIKIKVDDEEYIYEKVWMATVMYGKYLGGGMKIAPKQERYYAVVQVIVINKINLFLLLLILPTIYFGWHRFFKKFVHMHFGSEIIIENNKKTYLQIDGEVHEDIYKIKVTR